MSGFLQDVVNHVCYYGLTWECHPTSTMVLKTWLMRNGGVQNINCPFISAGTHIVLTFIILTYSLNITADFFTGHKYITELTYWNIHQWAPTLKSDLTLLASCKTCHYDITLWFANPHFQLLLNCIPVVILTICHSEIVTNCFLLFAFFLMCAQIWDFAEVLDQKGWMYTVATVSFFSQ